MNPIFGIHSNSKPNLGFISHYEYLVDTPSAAAVFNGTYVPPIGTDQCAIKILQNRKRPDTVTNAHPITLHSTWYAALPPQWMEDTK
jgi:hypothetical protein